VIVILEVTALVRLPVGRCSEPQGFSGGDDLLSKHAAINNDYFPTAQYPDVEGGFDFSQTRHDILVQGYSNGTGHTQNLLWRDVASFLGQFHCSGVDRCNLQRVLELPVSLDRQFGSADRARRHT
jgi:hypothetical protein